MESKKRTYLAILITAVLLIGGGLWLQYRTSVPRETSPITSAWETHTHQSFPLVKAPPSDIPTKYAWNSVGKEVVLPISGYGYELGDVLLIDRWKSPQLGDIVVYDCEKNNSYCMAMGPGVDLIKVIGMPGDIVDCTKKYADVNGQRIFWQGGGSIIWGTEKYGEMPDMKLRVPDGEYLSDQWVGIECSPDEKQENRTIAYDRYTVKTEAIAGIIVKKIRHDEEFEKTLKNIVY